VFSDESCGGVGPVNTKLFLQSFLLA